MNTITILSATNLTDTIKSLEILSIENLEETILEKLKDKSFIDIIKNNINLIIEKYKDSQYLVIKTLYINFYKYNFKYIAFKLQNILLGENAHFDDVLNKISMCKGDSKWEEAHNTIKKYLNKNSFKELELAQFYYIVGRFYIDDLNNFSKSKEYLKKSITIYEEHKDNMKSNIVKNSLSMYYFSNGDNQKANDILGTIYYEVLDDDSILYEENTIEVIFNNMFAFNLNNHNIKFKSNITFKNKEIEAYYFNSKAICFIKNNMLDDAKKAFNKALAISNTFDKNYAKSAILYNQSILLDDADKLKEASKLISEGSYTIGEHIIKNQDSKEHILNTFKINNKNYWVCLKNVDLLV